MSVKHPPVFISSFVMSRYLPVDMPKFSVAVYQPKGYGFPKAYWADIRESGAWIRPRDFISESLPLVAYRSALWDLYAGRHEAIERWVEDLAGSVALLCWCPYDKAAQRQLKDWGSFVCHTAVIGEYLSTVLKVPVWYDADRLKLTTLTQNWNVPQREEINT